MVCQRIDNALEQDAFTARVLFNNAKSFPSHFAACTQRRHKN